MMRFLVLLFGPWIWWAFSGLIRVLLISKGIRVGKGFYIEGVPILKIRGKPNDITIGNNVRFIGTVDIRNRENGKIHIGDGCKIDHGVRFVAANNALLKIGEETNIGPYCMFNCGENVILGRKCLVAGFTYIQSSNHGIEPGRSLNQKNCLTTHK